MKIGFDVGGVLYPKDNTVGCDEGEPNPEVLKLVKDYKENGADLYIISYLGEKKMVETLDWLKEKNIVPDLIPLDNVFFQGNDKRAKVVTAKCIKLDVFYDDSPLIIDALNNGVPNSDKTKRKKWKSLKGSVGGGPWKKMQEYLPEWESNLDGGFGGQAYLWPLQN